MHKTPKGCMQTDISTVRTTFPAVEWVIQLFTLQSLGQSNSKLTSAMITFYSCIIMYLSIVLTWQALNPLGLLLELEFQDCISPSEATTWSNMQPLTTLCSINRHDEVGLEMRLMWVEFVGWKTKIMKGSVKLRGNYRVSQSLCSWGTYFIYLFI